MAEIAALPWNGYNVVSTFSGCGGSSLGYKLAGYHVLWANEFIPAARDTYRANFPNTTLDARDIRTVQPQEILDAIGLNVGELDLLDGSPPCASFSTSGSREKAWGRVKQYSDTQQRTDDLFFEFARILKGLQPKVFVAENVSGLVKGTAKGYFIEIITALRDCGYVVEAKLLDAQWLGVPQARQRLIFVGVRRDLVARYGVAPAHPKPFSYRYTVREVLPWIVKLQTGGHKDRWQPADARPAGTVVQSGASVGETGYFSANYVEAVAGVTDNASAQAYERESVMMRRIIGATHDMRGTFHSRGEFLDKPAPAITAGVHSINSEHYQLTEEVIELPPSVEPEADISRYAIGREWDNLKPGQTSDKYINLARASLDKPSPTVTQTAGISGAAGVTHPTEKRKFSIAELRRICAFPDDFVLTGNYRQQWERLGRAVPPVMMQQIASTVAREILDRCRDRKDNE